jgi:glutathione S-transferase
MTVTLYGLPHSLYTGKARSYFLKAGIEFTEQVNAGPHYSNVVLPKAGNRRGIPTIELSDGEVIRDSTAIIDHFEDQRGGEFSPAGLKQNFISRLFDVIGMEGLLRPAMHYRWDFPENEPLLKFHFAMMFSGHPEKDAITEKSMNRMRNAGQSFGAVPDAFPLVESLYEEFIEVMNQHFAAQPYLLGSKPSIGDFGLIAPLFAHLARDPAPLAILQQRGLELLRWVERMNRPNADAGEFEGADEAYVADDEIPETLLTALKHIAVDFMPETRAAAAFANQWLDSEKPEAGSTAERAIGLADFEVRGQSIKAIVQPYRIYLLQRLFAIYDGAGSAQGELDTLLERIDMADLMSLRLSRNIGRSDNLEVWLD